MKPPTGTFDLSSSYFWMNLDSVFDTRRRSTNQVDEEITFQSYTLTGRYSLDTHSFLRADIPYLDIDWERNNKNLGDKGVGDIKLSYSQDIHLSATIDALLTFGLEFPTGDNSSDLNASATAPITNVRTGSGTFDPFAGLSLLTNNAGMNYFASAQMTVQGGDDDDGVRLGDSFSLSAGVIYTVVSGYTLAASLDGIFTRPTRVDDAPIRNSGYSWGFLSLEQSYRIVQRINVSLRLSYPVYRNVNGRQLAPDELMVVFSTNYAL